MHTSLSLLIARTFSLASVAFNSYVAAHRSGVFVLFRFIRVTQAHCIVIAGSGALVQQMVEPSGVLVLVEAEAAQRPVAV